MENLHKILQNFYDNMHIYRVVNETQTGNANTGYSRAVDVSTSTSPNSDRKQMTCPRTGQVINKGQCTKNRTQGSKLESTGTQEIKPMKGQCVSSCSGRPDFSTVVFEPRNPVEMEYFRSIEDTKDFTVLGASDEEFIVDFVLVYTRESLKITDRNLAIIAFLTNLEEMGLEIKIVYHTTNDNIIFVHLFATQDILLHYAETYDVDLMFQMDEYWVHPIQVWPECMRTEVTSPTVNSKFYVRAKDSLCDKRPNKILSKERITIVHKVLQRARYGNYEGDMGISKLLHNGTLLDAFPLHEKEWQWTEEGPLGFRQLLMRYWANPKAWFKAQPLDIIQRYYGTESALYFAWIGLYNKMLTFSAICAFCVFVYGLATIKSNMNKESFEYCKSTIPICPRCGYESTRCNIEHLQDHCIKSMFSYVMDNPLTMIYAIFSTCWAATFIELWRRKETILQYRWNLLSTQIVNTMRPEFVANTRHKKLSPVSGKLEPYVPVSNKLGYMVLTYATIIFMAIIAMAALVAVIVIRLSLEKYIYQHWSDGDRRKKWSFFAASISSFILAIFIIIFERVYDFVSMWLTQAENPRTQLDFDNSYIYKRFLLNFINNYCPFFYIAFFKGRFVTHPGDIRKTILDMRLDYCDLPSCVIDMAIQIFFVLFCKSIFFNLKEILVPLVKIKYLRRKHRFQNQWEEEFMLCSTGEYYLIDEYMEMSTKFGFITFFPSAFPIGPIFALVNNCIEVRIDAYKFTRLYRRPIPRRVASIGAWNGLMVIMMYLGIIFNAVVMSFTTNFIERFIYRLRYNSLLKGYLKFRLSAFDVKDLPPEDRPQNFTGVCYYEGFRHGPSHPSKYKRTEMYWRILATSLLFVLLFEIIMMILCSTLSLILSKMPEYVEEKIRLERHELREMKLKTMSDFEKLQIEQESARSKTIAL